MMSAPCATAAAPMERHFEPYADNGGSSLAIAGEDFCIVAADTRQSDGYNINTRNAPKAVPLTSAAAIAVTGFHADGMQLCRDLQTQIRMYRYAHDKQMSVTAIAQLTMTVLYNKRFFPYYAFALIGGLDEQGRGAVFSFDPVGSFERECFRASGSAAALIQPFLDSTIGMKNRTDTNHTASAHGTNVDAPPHPRPDMTADEAIKIARDAFASAAERDIYTGDTLQCWVMTREGVSEHRFPLRRD